MDRLVGIKSSGRDKVVIDDEGLGIFTGFSGKNGFVGDIGGNVYKFAPILEIWGRVRSRERVKVMAGDKVRVLNLEKNV